VQALHGQFELDSQLGEGTCIRVTVPKREKK
jgi:signal transduction histidine kinase